jgi:hypothetical protein
MKKIVLFSIIFLMGSAAYAVLNPLLSSFITPKKDVETVATTSPIIVEKTTPQVTQSQEKETKPEPQIDQTGGVHDGPFTILNATGVKTAATVQIIRSPEETLLQFEGEIGKHSEGAQIYFATDKNATKYFNLGPSKLNDHVTIYGMPIDANMSTYTYILIYNPTSQKVEFYAEI